MRSASHFSSRGKLRAQNYSIQMHLTYVFMATQDVLPGQNSFSNILAVSVEQNIRYCRSWYRFKWSDLECKMLQNKSTMRRYTSAFPNLTSSFSPASRPTCAPFLRGVRADNCHVWKIGCLPSKCLILCRLFTFNGRGMRKALNMWSLKMWFMGSSEQWWHHPFLVFCYKSIKAGGFL